MKKIIYRIEMFFQETEPFTEEQTRQIEEEIRNALVAHDLKLRPRSKRFRLAGIGYPRVRATQEIILGESEK